MSKKYVFELIIEEGNDEFWEGLTGSGVDDVTECVATALHNAVWPVDPEYGVTLKLVEFTNKE